MPICRSIVSGWNSIGPPGRGFKLHLSSLDLFFWVTGLVGEIALVAVLFFKKRASRLKVFTILACFYTVRTILLCFITRYGSYRSYFYIYWSSSILDVLLQIGVFLEGTLQIFRPTGHWASDIKRTLLLLLSGSVTFALAITWLNSPETRLPIQSLILRGNFFSSVLMSELFVAMVALSVTVGLPMNTHVSRVLNGWGVYSLVGIVLQGLQSYFGVARGTERYVLLSHIKVGLYILIAAYWTIALWLPAPEPRELPEKMRRGLLEMNRTMALTLDSLRMRGRA